MNLENKAVFALAAGMAFAAGWPVAVQAQDTTYSTGQRTSGTEPISDPHFMFWSKLKSENLYSPTNEKLGSISDAIIGRGSGRIEHLVVKTGSVLGLGGKTVVVPFSDLTWNASRDHLVLDAAKAQMKDWPEFKAETWSEVGEKADRGRAEDRAAAEMLAREAAMERVDAYRGRFAGQVEPTQLKGPITKVERRYMPGAGQYLFVTVDQGGTPTVVSMGPIWYYTSSDAMPVRGSEYTITAVPVGDNAPRELVAISSTIDGHELQVRNPDGSPMWTPKGSVHGNGIVRSEFVLASDLVGKAVDCRGTKCGKVADLVLESDSGHAGFLSIDPDQNFLGIADTTRLVPWTISTVRTDGRVGIDATKGMVLASPAAPKRFDDAAAQQVMRGAYDAYEVPAYHFSRHHGNAMNSGWSADGEITRAMKDGEKSSINGKIVSVVQGRDPVAGGDAVLITLDAADGRKTVIVGPLGENDALTLRSGEDATIEGWTVKDSDKRTVIAHQITQGGKTITCCKPMKESR